MRHLSLQGTDSRRRDDQYGSLNGGQVEDKRRALRPRMAAVKDLSGTGSVVGLGGRERPAAPIRTHRRTVLWKETMRLRLCVRSRRAEPGSGEPRATGGQAVGQAVERAAVPKLLSRGIVHLRCERIAGGTAPAEIVAVLTDASARSRMAQCECLMRDLKPSDTPAGARGY